MKVRLSIVASVKKRGCMEGRMEGVLVAHLGVLEIATRGGGGPGFPFI